jgi:LPS-assembly lipoprotein
LARFCRLIVLATALLPALAGCGFHPLYAERGGGGGRSDPQLASVRIEPIPDRIGQLLAMSLRDGFNPDGAEMPQRYNLIVRVTTSRRDVGIRKDATATRTQFDVSASYTLTRLTDKKVILAATSRTTNGFDIVQNEYATVVAEQSSRDTAVRQISSEIQTRVALAVQQYP